MYYLICRSAVISARHPCDSTPRNHPSNLSFHNYFKLCIQSGVILQDTLLIIALRMMDCNNKSITWLLLQEAIYIIHFLTKNLFFCSLNSICTPISLFKCENTMILPANKLSVSVIKSSISASLFMGYRQVEIAACIKINSPNRTRPWQCLSLNSHELVSFRRASPTTKGDDVNRPSRRQIVRPHIRVVRESG